MNPVLFPEWEFQNQHLYRVWGPLQYPIWCLSSSPLEQNGHHFTDGIFKCIFINETFCIWIQIWLKFVPKVPIDNNPALVQIMACRRIDDKSLSEAMLTWITDAYICSVRGRWVHSSYNFMKSRSGKHGTLNHITLKFDGCLCSTVAKISVNFLKLSDISKYNLVVSRLFDVL